MQGQRVLVTGSTKGIGKGIAAAMLKAGWRVVINSRTPPGADLLAEFKALGECHYVRADTSSAENARQLVRDAAAKLGGLDCLINNAGTFADVDFMELEEENFDRTFNPNVRGYVFASQEFARVAGAREFDANIILVGSINSVQAEPGSVIYDASKGAILMLVRSLAVNLAPRGIRVNGIGPGLIKTPLTNDGHADKPELVKLLRAQMPLGRLGVPADIGGAAVFLASPEASYITGQMLYIDGGIMALQMIYSLPDDLKSPLP